MNNQKGFIQALLSGIAFFSWFTNGSRNWKGRVRIQTIPHRGEPTGKSVTSFGTTAVLKDRNDVVYFRFRLRGGCGNLNDEGDQERSLSGENSSIHAFSINRFAGRQSNLNSDISGSDPDIQSRATQRTQTWNRKEGVQGTNDDSTMSKWSAAQAGYFEDEFLRYFALAQSPRRRRAPLINRGYAARVLTMRSAIRSFIKAAATGAQTPTVQVVNLGCGFDTTYLQLKMEVCSPVPPRWSAHLHGSLSALPAQA